MKHLIFRRFIMKYSDKELLKASQLAYYQINGNDC